jgi:hypothetical protein
MIVRIRRGVFGRWYIIHETLNGNAWSGSRWTTVDEDCVPTGGVQVRNFDTEDSARSYCISRDFTISREA